MYRKAFIRSVLILFLFFSYNSWIIGQYDNESTQELKTSALNDLEEGKYSSALGKYNALVSRSPKDGLFHYYIGIC